MLLLALIRRLNGIGLQGYAIWSRLATADIGESRFHSPYKVHSERGIVHKNVVQTQEK
jgi:hypothetical protein